MKIEHFKEQIVPLSDRYHAYAYGILRNYADASDVVQDLLSKLWTTKSIDQIKNLEAWSFRVLHNICIDRIRAEKVRKNRIVGWSGEKVVNAKPDDYVQHKELVYRLERCLEDLPVIQKRVFELREIEGLDYKGIAHELSVTMEQVKVYLFRARTQIRKQIVQWNK